MKRRLILVELNEVNPAFLRSASERFGLRNIAAILDLAHSRTTTLDRVEHHGLDPWVQWVGVHSGLPTSEHQIRHLGETRAQRSPQIWEKVAGLGNTWGVWGVMNAPRGDASRCAFFMPDPWSYDEQALPAELNDVLALPRYVSQNYLDLKKGQIVRHALRLVARLARPGYWGVAVRFALAGLRWLPKTRGTIHTFTTLLDYLSTLLFVHLRQRERPDFSVIFLNHIAHLQHHFWLAGDDLHPEMEVGLRLCDEMLRTIVADRQPGEALVVMNGFKQVNVAARGFCVYRQRSPEQVLKTLGVAGARVEQGMTNEAHLLFASAAETEAARRIIVGCVLSDGMKPFFVERISDTELFYQVDFEHKVADGVSLDFGDERVPFGELFELVAERTGAHVPDGDVYSDGIAVPAEIHNHEMFDRILSYYSVPALPAEPRGSAAPVGGPAYGAV